MFFPEQLQIMMCAEPVDMRKGFNGLEGSKRFPGRRTSIMWRTAIYGADREHHSQALIPLT